MAHPFCLACFLHMAREIRATLIGRPTSTLSCSSTTPTFRKFVPVLEWLERLEMPNVLANPIGGMGLEALSVPGGEERQRLVTPGPDTDFEPQALHLALEPGSRDQVDRQTGLLSLSGTILPTAARSDVSTKVADFAKANGSEIDRSVEVAEDWFKNPWRSNDLDESSGHRSNPFAGLSSAEALASGNRNAGLTVAGRSSDNGSEEDPYSRNIAEKRAPPSQTIPADAIDPLFVSASMRLDRFTPSSVAEIFGSRASGLKHYATAQVASSITAESLPSGNAYTVNHDTTLTVSASDGVLNQFIDSYDSGTTLTVSLAVGPSNGVLSLSSDGSFAYTPSAHFVGTDTFTFNLDDGSPTVQSGSVTIDVVNTAPNSSDFNYNVFHDHSLTADSILIGANDRESDTLTPIKVTDPSNGALTFNSDGTFTYTPNSHFVGCDSFTYKVNDGLLDSNVSTVNINVTNHAPLAADDAFSVAHDRTLYLSGNVLANDTDAESDSLTVTEVTGPSNGSVTLNADGSFVYTPNSHFVGTDTFTYTASDGVATSAPATVSIAVFNHAPLALGGSFSGVGYSGYSLHGTDPDYDPLTLAFASSPSHGHVSGSPSFFYYFADPGYVGTDSFTYTVNDGVDTSDPAIVSITDQPSSTTTPVAGGSNYSVTHDQPLTVPAPGVLSNVSNPGSATPLTASLVSNTNHGSVVLSTDGSFNYTPTAGFAGSDTFTFQATSSAGTSNVAMVEITVIDHEPIARGNAFTVNSYDTLTGNVLSSADDLDGDTMSASLVSGPDSSSGTLTFYSNGNFTFVPSPSFVGPTSFTYTVSDGIKSSRVVTRANNRSGHVLHWRTEDLQRAGRGVRRAASRGPTYPLEGRGDRRELERYEWERHK